MQSSSAMAIAQATAEAVLKDGIGAVPIHPLALPHAVAGIDWLGRQIGPFVTRKTAQAVLGCSQSKLLRLEAKQEIESFLDGAVRKISAFSVARYMVACAIATYPVDGPELKVRKPAKRYQKKPRPRTEAEKRGLAIGNAQRHEEKEARKRREAARA
jgi:hypothetical protein